MANKKPKLVGIRNFRSLSSAGKVDGKRVIDNRFYRSASLYHAPKETLDILYNDYNVRLIIDLRTNTEVKESPDPVIPGVRYLHIPVMEEENNGINRDNSHRPSLVERVATYRELGDTYAILGREEYSLTQFGKVIKECLDLQEGAVLWHCSAGKDRTGMVAFLLLSLFGFPKKLILADYLRTNAEAKRFAWKVGFHAFRTTHNRSLAHKVWRTMIAKKGYLSAFEDSIRETCGSLDGFYKKYCGLSSKDIAKAKDRFLK